MTGRLSSSDPNQQNIPSRGELGKKVRTVFDAPDGMDLVVIDYSQIEMRMMANESKDENLLRAFRENIDVHQMTADRAGVKRAEAKSLNFGWGYGMSYLGLMDAIEKAGQPRPSAKDAKKWLKDYDQAYPTLVRWKANVIRRARQLGYVPTIAGHHRRLPDLSSPVERFRMAAERQCVNARIQGCRSAGSRVATTVGYVKISDLYTAASEGKPYTILTYTGESNNYTVYQTGRKQTYRIRTNAGFDTVSTDHRFFVYTDGDLVTKRLSELAKGDMIVSIPTELLAGVPVPFSPDDAELVGILVGDGSYSARQHAFFISYGHDHDYADYLDSLLRRVFGNDLHTNRRRSKDSKGDSWQISVYGRLNREYLLALGLDRVSKEHKVLPEWLFTAPLEHRL